MIKLLFIFGLMIAFTIGYCLGTTQAHRWFDGLVRQGCIRWNSTAERGRETQR